MKEAATPGSGIDAFATAIVAALCGLAWLYLAYMAWGMAHMDIGVEMMIMPRMTSWRIADVGLVFTMWAIMMSAMMLPSAAPTILLFAALRWRLRAPRSRTAVMAF